MQLDNGLQACRVGGPEARDSYWLLLALLLGLRELNLSNGSIQPVVSSEQH